MTRALVVALLGAVAAGGCAAPVMRSEAFGRVELSGGGEGGDGELARRLLAGEDTAIKHARLRAFAERVKRAVAQDWRPDQLVRQRDPGGALLDGARRVIVVRVAVRGDGQIAATALARPCGIDYLDGEAEAVLRRTGPFRAPPPELRAADGLFHFNFGFLFSLSRPALVR